VNFTGQQQQRVPGIFDNFAAPVVGACGAQHEGFIRLLLRQYY